MVIRVNISDIKIRKAKLIGDLEYTPYGIYILDYEFGDGDVVEQDGDEIWIEMDEDKLFEL